MIVTVRVKKTTLWLNILDISHKLDTHMELEDVVLIVYFSVDDRA